MNNLLPNNVQRRGVATEASEQGIVFFRYTVLPTIIAFSYALFLTRLPIDNFLDRANYFMYARLSHSIENFYSYSLISYLTNEPVWLIMNSTLYSMFSDETVIRIFIFIPAFVSAYLLGSKTRFNVLLVMLVLIVPGVIQNYIIHIRQGVAISIFMAGFFSKDNRIRYSLIACAPFVHSAFFAITPLFFVIEISRQFDNLGTYFRFAIITIIMVIIVIFMSTIMSNALVRQAIEYQNIDVEFSGIGFLFWSAILILFLSEGRKFLEENMLQILVLIFYLMIYFIAAFSGRILECVLIPIFISGMSLTSWKRVIFVAAISLFAGQFYYSNRELNWFGWGL